MTAMRGSLPKKYVVSCFMKWTKKAGLKPVVEKWASAGGRTFNVFKITGPVEGAPVRITLGLDVFPPDAPEEDCWYKMLKRKCGDAPSTDRFWRFGFGPCSSLEELVLKMEMT